MMVYHHHHLASDLHYLYLFSQKDWRKMHCFHLSRGKGKQLQPTEKETKWYNCHISAFLPMQFWEYFTMLLYCTSILILTLPPLTSNWAGRWDCQPFIVLTRAWHLPTNRRVATYNTGFWLVVAVWSLSSVGSAQIKHKHRHFVMWGMHLMLGFQIIIHHQNYKLHAEYFEPTISSISFIFFSKIFHAF